MDWNRIISLFIALVYIVVAYIAGGVPSETPKNEQLRANMDYPDPGSWNWGRIRDRIEKWNNQ